MPRFINPIDDDDLYNAITLGGVRSPGKVTITGHDRKVNWDVKAGAGQSGATTTLKDIPPAEVTLTFYLVRDDATGVDDFSLWPDFDKLIRSTISGAKPKALDAYHPDLATNDIKSLVMSSIGGAVHDGKGGQTIVVKMLEYKPPKPKTGSPNGSSSKKPAAPDPNAAANAQIAALTAQYQNTPFGSP